MWALTLHLHQAPDQGRVLLHGLRGQGMLGVAESRRLQRNAARGHNQPQ